MDKTELSQEVQAKLGLVEVTSQYSGLERWYERYSVPNFSWDVGNGSRLLEGKVEDVSGGGFKILDTSWEWHEMILLSTSSPHKVNST